MKKRIADIVTEFSVEGLAAVQKALKKLAKEVRESGAKSERLDKHTESAAVNTERAAVAMTDLGEAADRAADSTDDLSKSLDKSHDAAARTAVSLEKVDTAADEAGRSVARSSSEMDDLARNAQGAAVEAEDLRRDVERVAPAATQAAEAVDDVADAAERAAPHVVEIERSLDSSADSSDRVSESLRDVGDQARDVSRDTDRVDDALSDAARSAGRTENALGDVGRSAGAAADDVDRIRDAARDVGPDARRAAAAVSDVGDAAGDAARDVGRVGDRLEDTARPASRLTIVIGRVRAVVQGVVEQLQAAGRSIRSSLVAAPAAVVRAIGVARSYVASTISALGGRVQVFSGLVGQALGDVASRTVSAFRSVRSTVVGALSGLASLAARSATAIGNGLAQGLAASRAVVRAALSSVLAGALSGLTGLRGLGRSAFDGLVQGARSAGAAIRTGFQSSLVGLGTALSVVGGAARSAFARLSTGARRAFRSLRGPLAILTAQIGGIASSIVATVLTVPGVLSGVLSSASASIVALSTSVVRSVGGAVLVAFAATRSAVTAGLGVVSGLVGRSSASMATAFSRIGTTTGAAFRTAGTVAASAMRSFGTTATRALGGVSTLVASAARALGSTFAAGARAAGSAVSALSRSAGGALRALPGILSSISRGFASMARGALSALRGIGSAAAGVARGIVSAFAGVGRSIAGALSSKGALLAGAGVGLGNLAVKGVKAFSPLLGLGAGAVAAVAGVVTMKDVKILRQASDALGLPVDVIQQWDYLGSQVGSTTEEVIGAMHALKTAQVGIASGDEAFKGVAELFKKAGLEVADSSGRFKTATALMADLALATRRLNTEQKNYIFSQLFGEADALALGTLFKSVGANYEALNANFEQGKARGQFITPQQMAQLAEFQVNFSNLIRTLKTLARELFLAFEPFFSQFIKFTNIKFALPEARTDWIDKVFVKPFQRGFQLLMDIMKAFWSFDFEGWFTGKSMGGVTDQNLWLYDVKKAALDVWAVFQGLVQLVYGVAEAFLSLFRAVDEVVVLLSGFSMEGWIVGDGARDFEAFARDVRKIMATLFGAPVDMSMLTTSFGKSLAAGVESIKSVIAPIWQAIVRDLVVGWNEFLMSLEDDRPLTAFYSWTGATLKLLNDFREDLVAFGKALWDVVVEGQPAPEQFKWLDDLKVIFEGIGKAVGAVAEAMKLLAPAYEVLDGIAQSFAGISGATALLLGAGLGRLGVLFAGLAAPLGTALVPLLPYAAAIGAVVGGIYLLYNLLTDFTGTIERIVKAIEWAWNKIGFGGGDSPSDDLTSDETTGPKRIDYMLRRSDLDIERQDIEAKIAATTDEAAIKALQAELARNSAALAKVTSELDAFDAAGSESVAEPATAPAAMSTAGQTMGREAIAAQMRAADAARSQATQAIRAQAAQAPEIQATSAEVEAATATTTAGTSTTNAQTATVQAGETKVDAATVQIITDQVPVTVNLGNGVTATGLFQRDQADEIVRAAANRIGGAR